MKTKITLCLLFALSIVTLKAQVAIANFDDGTLNGIACTIEGNAVSSFEVVDNPQTVGLNASLKSLKVANANGEWWGGLKMTLAQQITVSEENRYLHIMMKFKNFGLQNFHFALYSTDNEKWSELTNAQNVWFDYVVDLKNIENVALTDLTSLRFLSRPDNYTNQDNEVYIDEIVINNNPIARVGSTSTSVINEKVSLVNVFGTDNGITIQGVEGKFSIYNVSGVLIQKGIANGNTTVRLSKGFYIVDLGTECHKVSVK